MSYGLALTLICLNLVFTSFCFIDVKKKKVKIYYGLISKRKLPRE